MRSPVISITADNKDGKRLFPAFSLTCSHCFLHIVFPSSKMKSQRSTCKMSSGVISRPFLTLLSAIPLIFISQVLAETGSSSHDAVPYTNSTTNNQTTVVDTDMNQNTNDDDNGGSNAGLIAGLVIAVLVIVAVGVVFFIIHKRRSRMMDNEKKMKIQMTSARNAGVYQDLTMTVPADGGKPPASPEHERLQTEEI